MKLSTSVTNKILSAKNAALRGDSDAAITQCMNLWAGNKKSTVVFSAVATILVDLGEDTRVIGVIEEAIQHQGETEQVCQIVGEMGFTMKMPQIAEKAFTKACALNPSEPSHILHLANAYETLGRHQDAIGLLQSSLHFFQEYAPFWDTLGTLVCNYNFDFENGRTFINEAIRLDPSNAKYWHNLAVTYGPHVWGEKFLLEALKHDPDNTQIRLSYALYLLENHRAKDAWPYYEARLDPDFGPDKTVTYSHGLPPWAGEDLVGKTILICAEQGIGDEVFFSIFMPEILKRAKQVYIGCDPRLKNIYARSFAGSKAFGFSDVRNYRYRERRFPALEEKLAAKDLTIDYYVPVASLPHHLGYDTKEIRSCSGKIFEPESSKKDALYSRINATPHKLKIAVSWRSGNTAGVRKSYYLDAQLISKIAQAVKADFFVVQYSVSKEEHAALSKYKNIHFFDDIDMKEDIESNLAILSNVHASLGPPTATQMFAMAAGCPVCLVSNGPPWTLFNNEPTQPMFAANSGFIHMKDGLHFKPEDSLVNDISTYLNSLSKK